ncbi:VOC family protein [Mucilaginibacter sp. UR6-11]|uniref:VOC family protein n=1 Tax=Mucilaginibacter sp. UR6-11 TaxID=1435644 RepID=UPI001E47A706|nr:VOC family protein [Mucilaginibacter sp. UR6-11]MCC8423730.1 VOC family protein [Mucilaginibacter sp. UR6-11]
MSKITPFLWFDDNLDEAIKFYTSVFKNSKLLFEVKYGDAGPGPKGTTMTATFELEGQKLMALNGGPMFKFTEAISLFVNCDNQEEIDYYWESLSAGGSKSQCGWLKDKFGLSWQIVPANLIQLLHNNDPQKANNVMLAMLKMSKLDIAVLEQAGK